jgi:deoxyribodipyrimidine photo-lyase
MSTVLVWFRRDLRRADHPALHWAGSAGRRAVPVYVDAPHQEAPWPPGAASRWWLQRSLDALARDLAAAGTPLTRLAGDAAEQLTRAARAAGAGTVAWNRALEPALAARDAAVAAALDDAGLEVALFDSGLLHAPDLLVKNDGTPYRVYTPFARRLRRQLHTGASPLPAPAPRRRAAAPLPLDCGRDLPGLCKTHPWQVKLEPYWQPGEAGAWDALERFLDEAVAGYAHQRDLPGVAGTSRLSPHLHFGEVTPAQLLARLEPFLAGAHGAAGGAERFLAELLWREFAHHLLWHFPDSPQRSLNARFDDAFWSHDAGLLRRWQQGRTGFALVDAGMHELWQSGWMHNRVRMVAASLLTKQLGLDWRLGAQWFWETLVDADLANNTLGWQWVAGCGVDAAPYHRIFNPELQARRFDPAGDYCRRWLPAAYRRRPPPPLVDLRAARSAALARYRQRRTRAG